MGEYGHEHTLQGLVFLLVDGVQRRELGFEGRILLPLSDPVQASNQLCSQLGLAGADKEKTMTRSNAWKSKIRKFSYGGLLAAPLLLTGATLALSADDRQQECI